MMSFVLYRLELEELSKKCRPDTEAEDTLMLPTDNLNVDAIQTDPDEQEVLTEEEEEEKLLAWLRDGSSDSSFEASSDEEQVVDRDKEDNLQHVCRGEKELKPSCSQTVEPGTSAFSRVTKRLDETKERDLSQSSDSANNDSSASANEEDCVEVAKDAVVEFDGQVIEDDDDDVDIEMAGIVSPLKADGVGSLEEDIMDFDLDRSFSPILTGTVGRPLNPACHPTSRPPTATTEELITEYSTDDQRDIENDIDTVLVVQSELTENQRGRGNYTGTVLVVGADRAHHRLGNREDSIDTILIAGTKSKDYRRGNETDSDTVLLIGAESQDQREGENDMDTVLVVGTDPARERRDRENSVDTVLLDDNTVVFKDSKQTDPKNCSFESDPAQSPRLLRKSSVRAATVPDPDVSSQSGSDLFGCSSPEIMAIETRPESKKRRRRVSRKWTMELSPALKGGAKPGRSTADNARYSQDFRQLRKG